MPPPVPPKPTLQNTIPTVHEQNSLQRVSPAPPKPRRAVSTMALNQKNIYDKENYYNPVVMDNKPKMITRYSLQNYFVSFLFIARTVLISSTIVFVNSKIKNI
jgi:hypothetical protein